MHEKRKHSKGFPLKSFMQILLNGKNTQQDLSVVTTLLRNKTLDSYLG